MEHNVTKLGEKGSDHWAIHAQLSGFAHEKAEANVYDSKNMSRLQMILTERSSGKRQRKSTVSGIINQLTIYEGSYRVKVKTFI